MAQSHREASRRLFEFAEQQQGFFTTKQAKAAGFAENTHPYHVQAGNWIREHRGIYRLALFPAADRPDLVLWALWSRNRNEEVADFGVADGSGRGEQVSGIPGGFVARRRCAIRCRFHGANGRLLRLQWRGIRRSLSHCRGRFRVRFRPAGVASSTAVSGVNRHQRGAAG